MSAVGLGDHVWVKTRSRLNKKWFKIVLHEWCRLNRTYCQKRKGDGAYWTTERANVGVLGAAAWMVGGLSLEEFAVGGKRKADGTAYRGRVDLWITDPTGKQEVTIEAKHAFVDAATADSNERFVKKVKASLGGARASVTQTEIAGVPVAATFVVPWFDDPGHKSQRRFQRLVRLCRNRLAAEFVASYLHDGDAPPMEKGQHYLGVILVGRSYAGRPRPSRE